MKRMVIGFILLLFSTLLFADTYYIDGASSVMMRTNPNSNADVVVKLNRGTLVELLKTNLKNGYSYVRTDKQKAGWVRTLFLNEVLESAPKPNIFVRSWRAFKNLFSRRKPSNHLTHSVNQTVTLASVQKEVKQLQQKQHSNRFWFLMGALIAFIGFIIGFWFSSARTTKRSQWF